MESIWKLLSPVKVDYDGIASTFLRFTSALSCFFSSRLTSEVWLPFLDVYLHRACHFVMHAFSELNCCARNVCGQIFSLWKQWLFPVSSSAWLSAPLLFFVGGIGPCTVTAIDLEVRSIAPGPSLILNFNVSVVDPILMMIRNGDFMVLAEFLFQVEECCPLSNQWFSSKSTDSLRE